MTVIREARRRPRLTAEVRRAGTAARTARAKARALDIAPAIADIRAAGITSLSGIADALNKRGIATARGGQWSAVQVQRLLARL